jgi:hypothetical protein
LLPAASGKALEVFGDLFAGRDEPIVAEFDPTMLAQVPAAKLDEVRAQLRDTVGAYEHAGEPFARRIGKHTVVDVPLEFEAGSMNGRVAYDPDGKIAGLFVLVTDAA